jgi:hypothetical protein
VSADRAPGRAEAPGRVAVYLAHAEYRARESPTGIGAAVARSELDEDLERVWYCIVTDGLEWRHVRVQARGLGPFPAISPDDVEEGIGRFAAALPSTFRLRALVNANPLHLDRGGVVRD